MKVIVVFCAALALGLWMPKLMASNESPSIFTDIQLDPPPEPPGGQYLGTHTVVVNMEAMLLPAQSITLNLPGRDTEVAKLLFWSPRAGYIQIADPDDPTGFGTITIPDPTARPEDFSWRWYGKSDNYTVALTVVDGVIAGRITSAVNRYAVEPNESGRTRLGLVNSDYWQTHPGDNERPDQAHLHAAAIDRSIPNHEPVGDVPTPDATTGPGWDMACSGPTPGGQQVIDVLLFYTAGILNRYAGNVTSVHAVLQAAMDDANQALRNSGIQGVVFSPRGPELLPNATNPPLNYDLADIVDANLRAAGVAEIPNYPFYSFPGNAYVSGRRNTQWADIVAVARADLSGQGTCGISFANRVVTNNGFPTEPGPAFERLAYLMYDPACNADRLNLAHELGHQMGMEHDPSNFAPWVAPGNDPSCPWSYGHKRSVGDPRFRFRTVMSYWQNVKSGPGGPPSCGSSANCPQIDSFSTPLLEWAGDPGAGGPPPFGLQPVGTMPGAAPIGIAVQTPSQLRANGADTIKRIAPIVQDYRDRPELIFANGFQ